MSKEGAIVPRRPYWLMKDLRNVPEKVIFLNDKNLGLLKGYKAYVQVRHEGESLITITGLSKQCSKSFFDNLETLNPKEMVSDNK
jgi:hypothetical protein